MRFGKYCFPLALVLLASQGFSQNASPAASSMKKPLIYQIGQIVHINATGPRPLLQAVDALQAKYGWIVDYEDPRYPREISGSSAQPPIPLRRHANAETNVEEGFSVKFNVGPTPDSRPDEHMVLALLVDANNQGNAAGEFELRQEREGSFALVGVGIRDPQGESSGQHPILDTTITLASERRSVAETIALICHKLSRQRQISVTINGLAQSLAGREPVAVGGTEVPARALLSRVLAASGSNLYWRLLYDSESQSYQLTISRLSP